MKILPISILKVNNYQPQRKILSNYSQRFMTSQIRSVMFNLERIFASVSFKTVIQNQELMNNLGIQRFGRSEKVGIILRGMNQIYRISQPEENLLKVDLLEKKSSKISQSILFSKNSNEYLHAGLFSKDKTEELFSEVLDDADSKLLKIKKQYDKILPKPFLPEELTSEKIAELNSKLYSIPRNAGIKNYGFIDEQCKKVVQDLVKKINDIKILYKKIPNDTSRFNVRSYYKNYDTKQSRKNFLSFKNIGSKGETISVFYTTHKHQSYMAIDVIDKSSNSSSFVISKKGTVQRNLPYRESSFLNYVKRKDAIPDYLTQEEIDNSKIIKYLKCLNHELALFKAHTKQWLKTQAEFKKIHVNKNVATLDNYKEIFENISKNFQKYKTNVIKYIPKREERNQFKIDNGISTEISTTAVTLKNVTPQGYDLRLSYPSIPNKVATQILVLDGERVDKSFYILDNKLLKFEFKNKSDRLIHYNRNLYFYDKNYLKKSDLGKYLEILLTKFSQINEKLDCKAP